jgi:outer membrane protein
MLVLNVMLAYLSVLSGEDMVNQALSQSGTTEMALQRMQLLNNQGAVKPSDVSDLKGQLMNDQLSLLSARNNLESMKLLLLQLMNKPYDSTIVLQRINPSEFMTAYPLTAPEIFEAAQERFAAIKAAELRKKSFEYGLRATRGLYFPQLSLFGGINTNYSSLAQTNNEKIPYSSQLKNNRFTSVGIGVAIPIFNNSLVRNQVKLATINLESSALAEQDIRLQVQQQIDQAYLNMKNAYDRYVLLLNQVNSYEESFRAAEIRFQSGVGTSIDYLISKDRLDRANINLVNARYDFLLRKRILDYYKGETP